MPMHMMRITYSCVVDLRSTDQARASGMSNGDITHQAFLFRTHKHSDIEKKTCILLVLLSASSYDVLCHVSVDKLALYLPMKLP